MQNPAAVRLLAALNPLPYPDRMRLLAAQTRRLAADGLLDEVLDAFAVAEEYERQLALTMAKIAQREDRLIAALADPLYRLRVQALRACVRISDPRADAAVLATLEDAPLVWRRSLADAVASAGRTDLADLLATTERGRLGDRETARLLPACSAEVAAALLPELDRAVPNWGKIGLRHPELVLDYARAQLCAQREGMHGGWYEAHSAALIALAERHPSRVFELLEEFKPRHGLPHGLIQNIPVLIRADADRTLRLLVTSNPRVTPWWHVLSKNSRTSLVQREQPELERVGRALADRPAEFARLLRALRPSARSAFFDAVTADRDAATAVLSFDVLAALPRERRYAEVRRMLALDALAQRPERRLVLSALLPWAEARADLLAAARRPEPDDRAAGYALLIQCAAASGDPAVLTQLLTTDLDRLRNEQDPVRLAALTELADVAPELFANEEAVADALLRLVVDATEARDSSPGTHAKLGWLAARILGRQIADGAGETDGATPLLDWALLAFGQVAGVTGLFPASRLNGVLRRGQEHALYRALEPWIERGLARAEHRLPIALARALERRAWAMPALQEKLEQAIWLGTAGTARQAIGLWLGDPTRRDERVGRLVAWEPTVAAIPEVAHVLSLRRTDLLERYLAGEIRGGKFIASGVVWVPHFTPSLRWLPRQLTAYAALIERIAADEGAKIPARVRAVHGLGRVPGPEQRRVLRYLASAHVPLAEAALGALAWSDDPAADLPTLLARADGERARVAVYAATRAARFVRPSAAAPALREVALSSSAKVTSRKEVLRIAATLEIPGLVDLLVEVWQLPGQHRDVKAAAVSRLVELMDDPRVPPLLREAVADDPAVTGMLLRMQPSALAERHRAGYGELIAAACAAQDPKTAASAVSVAPRWYQWTDTVADAVCAAVCDLDRRGEYAASPTTLLSLLRQGMPIERYATVLEQLLAADAADASDAEDAPGPVPERDRPARRRLIEVVRTAKLDNADVAWRRAVLRATAEVLTGRVGYVSEAVQAAAASADLSGDPAAVTAQLLDLAARADSRPDAAAQIGHQLARIIATKDPWEPRSALAAADALAGRAGDAAAGIIAARVLEAGGAALGWPGPYRLALRALRRHADPAVAEAALAIDTEPS